MGRRRPANSSGHRVPLRRRRAAGRDPADPLPSRPRRLGPAALARDWDRPVHLHRAELPIATGDFAAMRACAGPLDRWVVLPLVRAMGTRRREAILTRSSLGQTLRTLDPGGEVPGLPDWECVPTPGHTPGHVSFFRLVDRVLITGDAFVTLEVNSPSGLLLQRPGLSGPPWYTTWNRRTAVASITTLARLTPAVLAGGHGHPIAGPATAAALTAFAGHLSNGKDTATAT